MVSSVRLWPGLVGVAMCAAVMSAQADQPVDVAEAMFNRGLSAYVYGHHLVAEDYATRVIDRAPNDPRAYYLRALSRLRTGRPHEGREDLRAAWLREGNDHEGAGLAAMVGRLSDEDRQFLQQYRESARSNQVAEQSRDSSPATSRNLVMPREERALRRELHLPLASLLKASEPSELQDYVDKRPRPPSAAAAADPGDPFVDDPPPAGSSELDAALSSDEAFAPSAEAGAGDDSDPFAAPAENPFEPGSSRPEQQRAASEAAGGEGIDPGKLPAILGRVLRRAVPLPEFDMPLPMAPGDPFGGGGASDAEFPGGEFPEDAFPDDSFPGEAAFDSPAAPAEDGFDTEEFEPAPMEASEPTDESEPTDAADDEDPFGFGDEDSEEDNVSDEDPLFGGF